MEEGFVLLGGPPEGPDVLLIVRRCSAKEIRKRPAADPRRRMDLLLVIERNLEVIKTADWIMDPGPEGGDGGGEIVAAGPPGAIVCDKRSYTGHFLRPVLARRAAGARGRATEAAE